MKSSTLTTLSIVVPVFDEASGLAHFHRDLEKAISELPHYAFEIIYVNDGSRDNSAAILADIANADPRVSVVTLSRNFGKEYALTAGITEATGRAIISLDADGQHPVELLKEFIAAWEKGAQVVVGVRKGRSSLNSRLFYRIFNKASGEHLTPGATDYRLLDSEVQGAFVNLAENGRITRGLIDWLGFNRVSITFEPKAREFGKPTYSKKQLLRLALHSFVSLSNVPLYIFGTLGVIITMLSGLLGLAVIIEQILLRDPLSWHFTGTAMLGILILFLIGIVLMSQGILSLYISSVHQESKRRPLYIINRARSHNLKIRKNAN